MTLDPQVQAIRARREAEGYTPLYEMSLERARAEDLASIQASSGPPEEVASAVLFFASGMSSAITGQSLDVNCGEWFA